MLLSENPKQGSEQCIQYSAFYLIKEKKNSYSYFKDTLEG